MDWLDQYLHELHRPGAVMHFPPDKPSWHVPVPSKQQLSLMQDATVADMVRMRMIQEARQMEMDAGAGGGYDAGSAARETTTVSPVAPAGIPVASTNAIVLYGLTGFYSDLNGTYTKSGDPTNVFNGGVEGEATGAVYFNSAYTGGNRDGAAIWYGPILFGSGNGWQITFYDDNDYAVGSIVSANTATVPISGYSNFIGYTGTITLTAAPSGIPVASTNSITIAGYGTFVKKIGGEAITSDGLTPYDGVAYARTPLSTSPNAIVLFGPPPTYMGDMGPNQFSEWTLYSVGPYEGGDANAWVNGTLIASSTSNDITTIPTSGWSPSITITAA